MVSMNKITIIGHLGRDPEMRYTPQGAAVTDFSVATSRRYTDNTGERREETDWFRVSAWRQLAELCNQYLQKGSLVYVEGRLHVRQYEANDGTTRFSSDVFASDVRFLNRPDRDSEGASGGGYGGPSSGFGQGAGPSEPDDLPF
jgi:single-strand DNA-binding protein